MENTEILGCSIDAIYTGEMKEFSINFSNITEIERETIKKIIGVTNFPSVVVEHITTGNTTNVVPKWVAFQTVYGYNSYKSMYEHTGIDKEAIKSLKKKKVILEMHNSYGSGSVGIFIYFTTNCDFYSDFLTRRVLIEKMKKCY